MTKNDVLKLFDLLEQLYYGHRRPRDDTTLSIWSTVLKPWSYSEVRDAVIKRARTNRHFPDPSEIAELLPSKSDTSWMKKYIDNRPEIFEKLDCRAAALREKYHAAGLPTASEAKSMGINYAAWCDMVDKAFPDGVPDPEIDENERKQTHGEF